MRDRTASRLIATAGHIGVYIWQDEYKSKEKCEQQAATIFFASININ